MSERFHIETIEACYRELEALHRYAVELEKTYRADLDSIPASHRESARNLIHYISLRRKDIRSLQVRLSYLGLSSLGRLEAHVLAGLESVMEALEKLSGKKLGGIPPKTNPIQFKTGDEILASHTVDLLGQGSADRHVRIMVTLPSEAASNRKLLQDLVKNGMNVARINAAHDDLPSWEKMAGNVREAANSAGRECKILVDLPGPKLRTGPIEKGDAILRVNPRRDRKGHVMKAERVILVPEKENTQDWGEDVHIPVSKDFIRELQTGDEVQLVDVPGRKRSLKILDIEGGLAVAETLKSIYFESGIKLHLKRNGSKLATTSIGTLPAADQAIVLEEGDGLMLTGMDRLGRNKKTDAQGNVISPARIPCSLPEIFRDVTKGDRIYFDDGKIGGIIVEAGEEQLLINIYRSKPGGTRLRSDKGINFPDSSLSLPALSKTDLEALRFAAEHADMVGYSFVRSRGDVEALHEKMDDMQADNTGVVLKVETKRAFENLPRLLLTGLKRPPLGIMVARGDLGVEVGFERMAEVQEQILWLCEAAHVPVIWATQVLEQMNKKGLPSRGEVTDAAMSSRAECVMLNKGPYVVKTVQFLSDILIRMQDHHQKKTPMLRRLKVSEGRWTAENEIEA